LGRKLAREFFRPFRQLAGLAAAAHRNVVWRWRRFRGATDGTVMYVRLPVHYAMFASIHRHLPHAKIVADDEKAASYLRSRGVEPTREKLYPDRLILADYPQPCEYRLWGLKKAMIFHGVGIKNYIDKNDNRRYLCLAPGEDLERRLKRQGAKNVRVVGYPKPIAFTTAAWTKAPSAASSGWICPGGRFFIRPPGER